MPMTTVDNHHIDAVFPDAQELLTTLNSIKPDAKVTADIAFTEDGLTVHWINKSKSLQSGIFLGKKLFEQYSLTSVVEFTVDVITLLSVLKVFIASDVGAIHMEYPGPNREFILKSSIRQSGSSAPTQDEYLLPTAYAKIETMAYASSANLLEYFNEPSSSILGKGSIFKDAIEDVTMASKDVLVEMKDRPQQLTFSSVSPEIEVYVDVPVDSLSAFACETPIVEARYNKKYLLNAFSVSPGNTAELGPDSHLCKVAIDPEGLMKVTHMWKMMPRNIAEQSTMGGDVHDESKQVMVVTQYVILPMIDGVDDNESEFNDMSSRAQ
ncbi:hypothetical protein PSENEW3_00003531 [Picochlorum sp. SENEW3]|nr:hypothetical protein PSENEW3_00003531 [Picochlorum sp. SENEW3]